MPAGDPGALVDALRRFRGERAALAGQDLFADLRDRITPQATGARMAAILATAAERRS